MVSCVKTREGRWREEDVKEVEGEGIEGERF